MSSNWTPKLNYLNSGEVWIWIPVFLLVPVTIVGWTKTLPLKTHNYNFGKIKTEKFQILHLWPIFNKDHFNKHITQNSFSVPSLLHSGGGVMIFYWTISSAMVPDMLCGRFKTLPISMMRSDHSLSTCIRQGKYWVPRLSSPCYCWKQGWRDINMGMGCVCVGLWPTPPYASVAAACGWIQKLAQRKWR